MGDLHRAPAAVRGDRRLGGRAGPNGSGPRERLVTAKGTILVHHPRAGDGSHSENLVAAMESNHLGPVAHHVVGQSGWRQKMRDDPGLVVVAGGDGTVADVLLAAG